MQQFQLVKDVVDAFNAASIPFMLTGSHVSSLQGAPRLTHDVDVLADILPGQVPALITAFPAPRYYLSEDAVREAIRRRHTFNILLSAEGDKADIWLLKDEPFDRMRFSRRREVEHQGVKLPISSPEDTILSKLKWSLDTGGSEKHKQDALHVYELQHGILDQKYLDDWAKFLKVQEVLQQIRDEAKPL